MVTDPNGNTISFEYNKDGKVKKSIIKDKDGNIKLVSSYTHNNLNRVLTLKTVDGEGTTIANINIIAKIKLVL
jgi:YD repeat-containing protein